MAAQSRGDAAQSRQCLNDDTDPRDRGTASRRRAVARLARPTQSFVSAFSASPVMGTKRTGVMLRSWSEPSARF